MSVDKFPEGWMNTCGQTFEHASLKRQTPCTLQTEPAQHPINSVSTIITYILIYVLVKLKLFQKKNWDHLRPHIQHLLL